MRPVKTITKEVARFLKRRQQTAQKRIPLPLVFPPQLLDMAGQIADLTGSWNPVELFTASNAKAEKAKFLEAFRNARYYNPEFQYEYAMSLNDLTPAANKLLALKNDLANFDPKNRAQELIIILLEEKIKDDLATCTLVDGIHHQNELKIRSALRTKYQVGSPFLQHQANQQYLDLIKSRKTPKTRGLLSNTEEKYLQNMLCTHQEIEHATKWALEHSNLLKRAADKPGFRVITDQLATSIDVRDKTADGPGVFIPAERQVNGIKLLQVIEHEISAHARQSANGQKLLLLGGGNLKIDQETFYEGLGLRYERLISEQLFGSYEVTPRLYPQAFEMAEQGQSFYEVFSAQLDLHLHIELKLDVDRKLPPGPDIPEKELLEAMESAWITSYRIFRSHLDTANTVPFGNPKDLGYFLGQIYDQELIDHGFGYINEAAILNPTTLLLMAELDFSAEDLPFPYSDLGIRYYREVLKPNAAR